MGIKRFTISRTLVFPTLAAALASNRRLAYFERAVIKGDNTRWKFGDGDPKTVNPTGSTFSQLPWTYSQAISTSGYAAPATATLTAAQVAQRYITTTSAAATTLTLPTAVLLAAQFQAIRGSEVSFIVDNSGGANTVTVAVGAGVTAGTGALTGSTTLTVPAGQFAKFVIIYTSATTALLYRTL